MGSFIGFPLNTINNASLVIASTEILPSTLSNKIKSLSLPIFSPLILISPFNTSIPVLKLLDSFNKTLPLLFKVTL